MKLMSIDDPHFLPIIGFKDAARGNIAKDLRRNELAASGEQRLGSTTGSWVISFMAGAKD
jgi:hypothetical protein